MPNDLIFRLAEASDLPTLAKMRWDNRLEATPGQAPAVEEAVFLQACLEFLERAHSSGQWALWLVEDPPVGIIGTAFVMCIDKVPRPGSPWARWGYVTNVYTHPDYRSQGTGGRLMELIKSWSREQGLEMLALWPHERSVPFYQRHGFHGPTECMEIELIPYEK
jgi:GNAT superfamily N-acetyltransferase